MSTFISSFRWPRTTYMWVRQIHLWVGAWGALAAILYGVTGLLQVNRMGDHPWPQGRTVQVGEVATLDVPEEVQASPEQLAAWLHETQKLDVTSIRKGGFGGPGGEGRGAPPAGFGPPPRGEGFGGGERGNGGDGRPRGDGNFGGGEGRPHGDVGTAQGGDHDHADKPRSEGFGAAAPAQRWTLGGGSIGNSWQLQYTPGDATATLAHRHSDLLAALVQLHKGGNGATWWKLLADSFAIGMILLGISGIWMWARGRSAKEMIVSVFAVATAIFLATIGTMIYA